MGRLHLFELEDLPEFPALLRNYMTDYLQLVVTRMHPYRSTAEPLREALLRSGAREIIDLGSGAGGPWAAYVEQLDPEGKLGVRVTLTDLYPNREALEQVASHSGGRITWERESVDLTAVPARLRGFRTLFGAFHHFPPETARKILEDAVRQGVGIGIVEATTRSTALGMLVMPLIVALVTPGIRPFRWSRLLLTYVLPVLPLAIFWDGFVSSLRSYTPDELRELTRGLGEGTYTWEIGGEFKPGSPPVTYLIGYPRMDREQ